MNLLASMVARNECGRYLAVAVEHALTYCDGVVILDDGATDELSYRLRWPWLFDDPSAVMIVRRERDDDSPTFDHEGQTRQMLLEATLAERPTHVIVIDADEFVTDGPGLRAALEADDQHIGWRVCMEEVWRVGVDGLDIRCDGGWRPHPIPMVYRAPVEPYGDWRMLDQALACPREPVALRGLAVQGQVVEIPFSTWHFGWARPSERARRHARYVDADGGRFHRNAHIESIGWADEQIDFERVQWPAGLDSVRSRLIEITSRL